MAVAGWVGRPPTSTSFDQYPPEQSIARKQKGFGTLRAEQVLYHVAAEARENAQLVCYETLWAASYVNQQSQKRRGGVIDLT
ncbi:hypothetical protein M406DRAFT_58043 [Cryphonectria parasitica EP155]|uniref:Uncharacterized protein n=1 Tax=Cryphonectria parasitica (strain ATCC 38755 / EP155) TaxID=660469 RepID=A0A9P4XWD3_CRYP1|nr:uncharacterized protein M406DRAFT_58043 [Cryphonectria parasitica EP155]KAF3761995.1 hypothetical protein M406DRAFT_58043 [Cryphonectria parasitica EP155]